MPPDHGELPCCCPRLLQHLACTGPIGSMPVVVPVVQVQPGMRLTATWNYSLTAHDERLIRPLTETRAGDADHEPRRRFCGVSPTGTWQLAGSQSYSGRAPIALTTPPISEECIA